MWGLHMQYPQGHQRQATPLPKMSRGVAGPEVHMRAKVYAYKERRKVFKTWDGVRLDRRREHTFELDHKCFAGGEGVCVGFLALFRHPKVRLRYQWDRCSQSCVCQDGLDAYIYRWAHQWKLADSVHMLRGMERIQRRD